MGLTDYEARAYLGLLREGPLTGYAVAKASGIPTSKSYEAVDGLARKGGATLLPGDPPRHAAVPPDALLAQARQRMRRHWSAGERLAQASRPHPAATRSLVARRAGCRLGADRSPPRPSRAQHCRRPAALCARRTRATARRSRQRGRPGAKRRQRRQHLTLLIDDREAVIASLAEPAEFVGTGNPALLALCRLRLRDASSSPFLRPSEEAAEWLRWEEKKGLRLLHR